MSTLRPQDRVPLCRFTFADGRKCLTPRSEGHPHFCYSHARKAARSHGAEKLARELSYYLSADYLSACDISTAIGCLIPAVVRGDIKPKTATTVAYLAQTLVQTIHLSQHEYINAFGTPAWRDAVRNSVDQNFDYRNPPPLPQPAPQPDPATPSPPELIPTPTPILQPI